MFPKELLRGFVPLLLITLVGCQAMAPQENTPTKNIAADTQASSSLDHTYWRVKNLVGRDVSVELNASVAFRDNRLSGRAGCNFFFAEYTEAENRLNVEGITTSKKICFAAVMQQEQLFLRTLASANRFEKDNNGDLLIYSRRSNEPVILKPISSKEMPALVVR